MSTNFFIYEKGRGITYHVGKRFAVGGGKTGWMWDMSPEFFWMVLSVEDPLFKDELGNTYTFDEMANIIRRVDEIDYDFIGKDFL